MSTTLSPRDLCTEAEREHMHASLQFAENPGSWFGQVTCEHPTRLHEQFLGAPHNDDHELLNSEDLGNGWTRVTYLLNVGLSRERDDLVGNGA